MFAVEPVVERSPREVDAAAFRAFLPPPLRSARGRPVPGAAEGFRSQPFETPHVVPTAQRDHSSAKGPNADVKPVRGVEKPSPRVPLC